MVNFLKDIIIVRPFLRHFHAKIALSNKAVHFTAIDVTYSIAKSIKKCHLFHFYLSSISDEELENAAGGTFATLSLLEGRCLELLRQEKETDMTDETNKMNALMAAELSTSWTCSKSSAVGVLANNTAIKQD